MNVVAEYAKLSGWCIVENTVETCSCTACAIQSTLCTSSVGVLAMSVDDLSFFIAMSTPNADVMSAFLLYRF